MATIRSEIVNLQNAVQNIVGFRLSILRPPFGSINDNVLSIARDELNYNIILWNLDSGDWQNGANPTTSMQAYRNAFQNTSPQSSSFIALHHDPLSFSPALAREAINYARQNGYNPVRVAECIGIPDSGIVY